MFVRNVKEMSRGTDWVKFLVEVERMDPFGSGYDAAKSMHDAWLKYGINTDLAGETPELMRFNFDKDKIIFKFKTEPFSMKSNAYFSYVYEFGKWVESLSPAGSCISVDTSETKLSVTKPGISVFDEPEARSLISRIMSKTTV